MTVLLISTRQPDEYGKADQVTVFKLAEYLSLKMGKDVSLLYPRGNRLLLARLKKQNTTIIVEEYDSEKVTHKDYCRLLLGKFWSLSPLQVKIYARYSLAYRRIMQRHRFGYVYAHLARSLGFVSTEDLAGCGLQISHYLNYSRLCRELPLSSASRYVYELERRLMRSFERNLFKDGKFKINLISTADSDAIGIPPKHYRLLNIAHGVNLTVAENVIEKPFCTNQKVFGFLANFAPETNRVSLRNLVYSIWPEYIARGGEGRLIIAGRNIPKEYFSQCSVKDIVFVGEVANLESFYEKIDFVLNPVRACAGMQNKVLTALAFAKPCIAFKEGNEGLNLPNSLIHMPTDSINSDFVQLMIDVGEKEIQASRKLSSVIMQKWSWDAKHKEFVEGMGF